MNTNRELFLASFLLFLAIVSNNICYLLLQNSSSDKASYFSSLRFYDPKTGKFIQSDSVVPEPASLGLNRYAYAYNCPVKYVDPDGHVPRVTQDPDEEGIFEKLARDAVDIIADTLQYAAESTVLNETSKAGDVLSDPEASLGSKLKALVPVTFATIAAGGGASKPTKPRPPEVKPKTKGVGFIDLGPNHKAPKHDDWGDDVADANGRPKRHYGSLPADSAGRLSFTSSPALIKQQAATLRDDLAAFVQIEFTPGQIPTQGPQYLVSARASYLAQRAWRQRNQNPHRLEYEVLTHRFSKETPKEGIAFRDIFFKQNFYDAAGRYLGSRAFKVTEAWNRQNVHRFRVRVEKEVVRRNRRLQQNGQTPPRPDRPRGRTFGKGWKGKRMPGSEE